MNQPVFKTRAASTKEAQLRIGPVASVFYPAAEEVVLAGNPETRNRRKERFDRDSLFWSAASHAMQFVAHIIELFSGVQVSPQYVRGRGHEDEDNLDERRLTSSSASRLRIQSPDALSSAEFFCAAKPFHGSTKTFAP